MYAAFTPNASVVGVLRPETQAILAAVDGWWANRATKPD